MSFAIPVDIDALGPSVGRLRRMHLEKPTFSRLVDLYRPQPDHALRCCQTKLTCRLETVVRSFSGGQIPSRISTVRLRLPGSNLREVEVALAQGAAAGQVCRHLG